MATVAINGLGRIGRAALKIVMDADGLELVAVNDIVDAGHNLVDLISNATVMGPTIIWASSAPFYVWGPCP